MNNENKNVGIITLPLNTNYGGTLQAYALHKTLEKLGYNSFFINRRWNNDRKDLSYKIKKTMYKNVIARNFTKFNKVNLQPSTEEITSEAQMKNYDWNKFRAIIVGSDQVWRFEHTTGVGNNYFLDFITTNNIKKISYAASFGTSIIKCDNVKKKNISELLKSFNAISVREDSGVEICKNEFDVDAIQVLDPTLLLEKDEYLRLIEEREGKKEKNILATYVLDNSSEKLNIINKVRKTLELNTRAINSSINITSIKSLLFNMNNMVLPSIESWIKGINEADFVVTDSFHGTVFSIIFNKQFLCIGNKERGLTRFTSLLKLLDLEDRLIFSEKDINETLIKSKINYEKVNKILKDKRRESLDFLIRSIKN